MHCSDLEPSVTSCFISCYMVHLGETTAQRYSKLQIPHLQRPPSCPVWDCSPDEALFSASLTNLGRCTQPSRKALQISLLQLESRLRDLSTLKSGWTLPQIT